MDDNDGPMLWSLAGSTISEHELSWGILPAIAWIATRDFRIVSGVIQDLISGERNQNHEDRTSSEYEKITDSLLLMDVSAYYCKCSPEHGDQGKCKCRAIAERDLFRELAAGRLIAAAYDANFNPI